MKILDIARDPGFDKCVRMFVLGLCLFLLGTIAFYCLVAQREAESISMILTAVISVTLQIVGYDWGSSAGSKTKDEVIGKLLMNRGKETGSETNPLKSEEHEN